MKPRVKSLGFECWPAADQHAWRELFRERDILDDGPTALDWSEQTRITNRKHYERWLGWLQRNELLDPSGTASSRVTRERVTNYARYLRDEIAPVSVYSAVNGLKCVLLRMDPEADWKWFRELTNRLKIWAKPSRSRAPLALSANRVFADVVQDLHRRMDAPIKRASELVLFRDTLLIGILVACPIRRRNLHMMKLDKHLIKRADRWIVNFQPEETKAFQEIRLDVPAALNAAIDFYLAEVRPRFHGASRTTRVWVTSKGRPMAGHTIYDRVCLRTKELYGRKIPPHEFRVLAATFLAERSSSDALRAAPLLGHRGSDITEKHYTRASLLEASKEIAFILEAAK